MRCIWNVFQRCFCNVFQQPTGADRHVLQPKATDPRPDWGSFFAREVDPEIANWELKREQPESRDIVQVMLRRA
jgi:hypothetical protein